MGKYLRESHHTTANCIDHLADTGLAGRAHAVDGGYVLRDPEADQRNGLFNCPHQAVVVHGAKGSILYTGLGWGYSGEGAYGLCRLLDHLGMDIDKARELVAGTLQLPMAPPMTEFGPRPAFVRYWRIQIPNWHLEVLR